MQMAAIINLPWNRCTLEENLFFFTVTAVFSMHLTQTLLPKAFNAEQVVCCLCLCATLTWFHLHDWFIWILDEFCVVYVSECKWVVWPSVGVLMFVIKADRRTDGQKVIVGVRRMQNVFFFWLTVWSLERFRLRGESFPTGMCVNWITTVNLEKWTGSFFTFAATEVNRPFTPPSLWCTYMNIASTMAHE